MCAKVVEHQAPDRNLLQIQHPGRLRNMRQRGMVGMEGQRDKGLEAARLVLHRAQLQQVVDAVLVVLDVAVEHRRVRAQPDLVRRPARSPATRRRRSCGRR